MYYQVRYMREEDGIRLKNLQDQKYQLRSVCLLKVDKFLVNR